MNGEKPPKILDTLSELSDCLGKFLDLAYHDGVMVPRKLFYDWFALIESVTRFKDELRKSINSEDEV